VRHECVMALGQVEAEAEVAGYRLAQRHLHGQKVWWWQRTRRPRRHASTVLAGMAASTELDGGWRSRSADMCGARRQLGVTFGARVRCWQTER